MASWTDDIQTFNPYIQQVPVEAYASVGIQKQAMYDTNVQKIQGQLDSLGGIDVVKEEHKQYLNQRLTQLQTEVNKVVGGDFSKSQLVNQVGGLTKQLASDRVIQNAVQSTQKYRQEQTKLAEARASGKGYSVVNEWDFNNQAEKWLTDKDATSSFTGSYSPFVDVRKKMMDVIKAIDPSSTLTQLPFSTDVNGNILIDPTTGEEQIDWAMVERSVKGKSKDQIMAAIHASLDQNDLHQLGIEGKYKFRQYSREDMKGIIDSKVKNEGVNIVTNIDALRAKKALNPSDRAYQDAIDTNIKQYEQRLNNLNSVYLENMEQLDTNPEGFKANYFANGFVQKMGEAFQSTETSEKILSNPKFQGWLDEKKYELELAKFMAEKDKAAKETKTKKEKEAETKVTNLRGEPEPVNVNDINIPTEFSYRETISSLMKNRDVEIDRVLRNVFGEDGLRASAAQMQKEKGLDADGYRKYMFDILRTGWKNGMNVPPNLEKTIENINNLDKRVKVNQQVLEDVLKEADKSFKDSGDKEVISQLQPATVSVTIPGESWYNMPQQRRVELSPADILDIANIQVNDEILSSREQDAKRRQAEQRILNKFGEEVGENIITKARQNAFTEIADQLGTIGKTVNATKFRERQDFINRELMERGLVGKPEGYSLKTSKPEEDREVKQTLLGIIGTQSQAIDNDEIPAQEDLIKILNSDEITSFKVLRVPSTDLNPGGYRVRLVDSSLGNHYLDITQQQAEQLTGLRFNDEVSPVQQAIESSGSARSTNTSGDPDNAYFAKTDFKNAGNVYTPAGDIMEDLANPGQYFVRLYLRDNEEETWRIEDIRMGEGGSSLPLTLEQAHATISKLTAADIEKIFFKELEAKK